MSEQDNEMATLWRIIKPHWLLIITCGIILSAIGLFSQMASPKVFQGEVLIALPKVPGANPDNEDTTFVSVPETRAVITQLQNRLRQGDETDLKSDSLLKKLHLVRIDDIRGSGNYFKMTIRSQSEPQAVLATLDRLVSYLNNSQFLMSGYELKRSEMEAGFQDVALAMERATKLKEVGDRLVRQRANVGFNPVELETKMNELQGRYLRLKTQLSLVHNYRYVDPPYVRNSPISPRPWRTFFLYGFLGLILGLMLTMLAHFIRTAVLGRQGEK